MTPITNEINTNEMTNELSGRRHNSRFNGILSQPFLSGMLGMVLLLPATWFGITLALRVFFGSATLYHSVAPSFLQSPFVPFAWHKAQLIIGSVLLAILLNGLTILRFRLQRGRKGWDLAVSYRRYWLNTAIALQSALLFIALVAYMLIQHIRY